MLQRTAGGRLNDVVAIHCSEDFPEQCLIRCGCDERVRTGFPPMIGIPLRFRIIGREVHAGTDERWPPGPPFRRQGVQVHVDDGRTLFWRILRYRWSSQPGE